MLNNTNSAISRDSYNTNTISQKRSVLPLINLAGPVSDIVPNGFPAGIAYEVTAKTPYYSNGAGWFPMSSGATTIVALNSDVNITGGPNYTIGIGGGSASMTNSVILTQGFSMVSCKVRYFQNSNQIRILFKRFIRQALG